MARLRRTATRWRIDMTLRLLSKATITTGPEGPRPLEMAEIDRILEMYRADLREISRRFRARETNALAARIAYLEAEITFWKCVRRAEPPPDIDVKNMPGSDENWKDQ